MIILCKRDLMNGDFAANMKLLQAFPVEKYDVSTVVTTAKKLLINHPK